MQFRSPQCFTQYLRKAAVVSSKVKAVASGMIYTQHCCAKCGSEHVRRNGTSQGHAKYQCKSCNYQGRFAPAAVAKAAQYAQVDKLLAERNSQRSIVRATGISRMSIARRLKKSPDRLATAAATAPEEGAAQALASTGAG